MIKPMTMVVDTEKKEVVKIEFEDVDIWPDWCVRDSKKCIQCHLEGKIACHPRFRKGLKHISEVSVEALLKEGKRPLEIHNITGTPLPTIYSKGQKLRDKGELQRLLEPHPKEEKEKIVNYVRVHKNEQYKDIAILFNVEASYISRLCSKAGIHRREMLGVQKSQLVDKALKILQDEPTRSITSIAEEIGMAPSTLSLKMKEKGTFPVNQTSRLVLATIREEVIKAVKEALPTTGGGNIKKEMTGNFLHHIIACRQETQQIIEGVRRAKGSRRISEWRKCVDGIIGWLKKGYAEEFEIDREFVCYHITKKDRLLAILKEGLKPNSDPSWFKGKTPYIMLSKYPYWHLYGKEEEVVLLEIKHPDILPEYFNDPEGLRWGETIDPKYINEVVEFKVNDAGPTN